MAQDGTSSNKAGRNHGRSTPRRRQITRKRKWLFRIVAATIVPVALLVLVELGLVLGGYGTASSFFTKIPGRDAYTTNQRYGWRFFPTVVARQPVPCHLPAAKADDAYRIFVLGGSAAQGIPERAFAFGRILEVMLEENYPRTKFQVVNAAMTAINSHVVREIARNCAEHDPDLFIVYMGHNEVVGPYGPGTVFAGFSGNLAAVRWSIRARSTRLGQLLRNVGVSFGGSGGAQPRAWRGMRMFERNRLHANDPRLAGTYAHFRQNLLDICDSGTSSGARVIVCTVPSDLRSTPPFASLHRADLTGSQQAAWDALYADGKDLEQASQHARAIDAYLAAAAIDDTFAELRFRLGRCYLNAGDRGKAAAQFTAARDLDALRFRADTRVNQIIREVAEQVGGGVQLVDAHAALAQRSAAVGGILGNESFHEHVHLKFAGNYAIAAALFEAVTTGAMLPQSIRGSRNGVPPSVPTQAVCARRLALSDWARVKFRKLIRDMTSDPPFTGQIDHDAAQKKRQQIVDETAARLAAPGALRAALTLHAAALDERPDDLELIRLMALILADTGAHAAAAKQWRGLLHRIPRHGRWQIELGTSLVKQGAVDEAVTLLEQGMRVLPDDLAGHVNLGNALLQLADLPAAAAHFRRVLEFEPDHFIAHSNLGVALLNMQQPDEATDHLRKALALDAGNAGAHLNLGLALSALGNDGEAADEFRQALKLNPNHTGARQALEAIQSQSP